MNHFARYWSLGYRLLIPVVPPGVDVSERSTLYKRIGTSQDARGKVPGVRGRDGLWHSFDWTGYSADEHDLDRWHAMGASLGVKTGAQGDGSWLLAIDADTLDKQLAQVIHDAVRDHLGLLPMRFGNRPKALYLCRSNGPLPYQRIEFGAERVEILSDGKQFVAEGIHPVTGRAYEWPRPIVPYAELPMIDLGGAK